MVSKSCSVTVQEQATFLKWFESFRTLENKENGIKSIITALADCLSDDQLRTILKFGLRQCLDTLPFTNPLIHNVYTALSSLHPPAAPTTASMPSFSSTPTTTTTAQSVPLQHAQRAQKQVMQSKDLFFKILHFVCVGDKLRHCCRVSLAWLRLCLNPRACYLFDMDDVFIRRSLRDGYRSDSSESRGFSISPSLPHSRSVSRSFDINSDFDSRARVRMTCLHNLALLRLARVARVYQWPQRLNLFFSNLKYFTKMEMIDIKIGPWTRDLNCSNENVFFDTMRGVVRNNRNNLNYVKMSDMDSEFPILSFLGLAQHKIEKMPKESKKKRKKHRTRWGTRQNSDDSNVGRSNACAGDLERVEETKQDLKDLEKFAMTRLKTLIIEEIEYASEPRNECNERKARKRGKGAKAAMGGMGGHGSGPDDVLFLPNLQYLRWMTSFKDSRSRRSSFSSRSSSGVKYKFLTSLFARDASASVSSDDSNCNKLEKVEFNVHKSHEFESDVSDGTKGSYRPHRSLLLREATIILNDGHLSDTACHNLCKLFLRPRDDLKVCGSFLCTHKLSLRSGATQKEVKNCNRYNPYEPKQACVAKIIGKILVLLNSSASAVRVAAAAGSSSEYTTCTAPDAMDADDEIGQKPDGMKQLDQSEQMKIEKNDDMSTSDVTCLDICLHCEENIKDVIKCLEQLQLLQVKLGPKLKLKIVVNIGLNVGKMITSEVANEFSVGTVDCNRMSDRTDRTRRWYQGFATRTPGVASARYDAHMRASEHLIHPMRVAPRVSAPAPQTLRHLHRLPPLPAPAPVPAPVPTGAGVTHALRASEAARIVTGHATHALWTHSPLYGMHGVRPRACARNAKWTPELEAKVEKFVNENKLCPKESELETMLQVMNEMNNDLYNSCKVKKEEMRNEWNKCEIQIEWYHRYKEFSGCLNGFGFEKQKQVFDRVAQRAEQMFRQRCQKLQFAELQQSEQRETFATNLEALNYYNWDTWKSKKYSDTSVIVSKQFAHASRSTFMLRHEMENVKSYKVKLTNLTKGFFVGCRCHVNQKS